MKVLVIPDCHLKPWMIDEAIKIKEKYNVDTIVVLGDLVDDWNKQFDKDLYRETLDSIINLVKRYPETKVCFGNHDFAYLHNLPCSGYSSYVNTLVISKLKELMSLTQIKIIHRIDKVLFSHAGLCDLYINQEYELTGNESIDEIINLINELPPEELWNNFSPLWVRPQHRKYDMYQSDKYVHVVGHTPIEDIFVRENLILCDVFSTYSNGLPIGNQKFIIIDTEMGKIIKKLDD